MKRNLVERTARRVAFGCVALLSLTRVPTWAQDPGGDAATEAEAYRLISIVTSDAATESRSKRWKPAPDGLALEVSGIDTYGPDKLAVAIRKGEVWILDHVYDDPPSDVHYSRFATALHEPLGLLHEDGDLYTVQRTELTRLRDTDDDGKADEYLAVANGWGVTGNYHEYAYGPKRDGEGNLWLTLNSGLGLDAEQRARIRGNGHARERSANQGDRSVASRYQQALWRGWGLKVTSDGTLVPMCAGMRSPSGLGANAAGDMFFTDQQGNWVGTCTLHHMHRGAFFGYPDALASAPHADSPLAELAGLDTLPADLPFPEALAALPQLTPPVVWFPYKKMGQSATDVVLDNTHGRFGPFHGQLFVGEFTLSAIHRVFLETVDGHYQGACFPFREGFAAAVIRMAFGSDGSLFVGLSNRGWSSVGTASYGLQRLVWTGETPFEILEMRATPEGFDLLFTRPVDPATAGDVKSYAMKRYTYLYRQKYGSDEVLTEPVPITRAVLDEDGRTVHLHMKNRRRYFVHELVCHGVRSQSGAPLVHADAYYTLNAIP